MTDYADKAAQHIVALVRKFYIGYVDVAAIVRETCEKQVAEAVAGAIEAAVEWTCKSYQKREDAPLSWDARFPGIKASALLSILPTFNAQAALADHDAALTAAVREQCAKYVESDYGGGVPSIGPELRKLPLLDADRWLKERDERVWGAAIEAAYHAARGTEKLKDKGNSQMYWKGRAEASNAVRALRKPEAI